MSEPKQNYQYQTQQQQQQQQQAKQHQRQQQQQLQYAQQQQRQRKPKEFQMEDAYYDAREINGLSELTISEYGQKQMRFNKQRQRQPQPQSQQNSLLTTHNLPKSSFRGNIKYSQNNGNTYSDGGNKYSNSNNNNNNHNYQYKSNSSSSNKNKNNMGYSISNQIGGSNDRSLNSRNQSNHSHNNSVQSKHSRNKSTSTNANNLDNDELKDYKSKIKNKYNIDYDHSLDDEYEIIEAIE